MLLSPHHTETRQYQGGWPDTQELDVPIDAGKITYLAFAHSAHVSHTQVIKHNIR
jgi:hypothetical protein